MFKKGDIVKCINIKGCNGLSLHKKYQVSNVYDYFGMISITVITDTGQYSYYDKRFRLVKDNVYPIWW